MEYYPDVTQCDETQYASMLLHEFRLSNSVLVVEQTILIWVLILARAFLYMNRNNQTQDVQRDITSW